MNPDWKSRYDLAVTAARAAGDLARGHFDRSVAVEWKADDSPVTVADRDAEAHIRAAVEKHFPHDGLLGEEHGDRPGTTGYRWVIDPIDGTRSFVRGVPIWGTLLGLEFNGEQIAGVCYAPALNGTLWRALRGDGAYRDDRRITVSDVATLATATLCYSSVSWFRKAGREGTFLELASRTERQRGFGDFYGFVLVAQGSCDLMVDAGVHAWDVSALIPIVEEAGGRLTNWDGEVTIHSPNVLASNGTLHAETLGILNGPPAGRT